VAGSGSDSLALKVALARETLTAVMMASSGQESS
jgi:hypothetical protein